MKSKLKEFGRELLKWTASITLLCSVFCLTYLSTDVLESIVAGLKVSPINGEPVSIGFYFLLWAGVFCALKCFMDMYRISLNREAGKKTIAWLVVKIIVNLLILQAGVDIAFSNKLGMHTTLLFGLPVSKWLLTVLVLGWFLLASNINDLIWRVFHEKGKENLQDFMKEEDQEENQ